MFRKSQIIIISILAILVVVAGAVLIWRRATSPGIEKNNFILNFVLPEEIVLAGESIPLTWTDDNTGENLIIQSDRQYYDGRDSSEVYFSITNISDKAQKPDIKFLFDQKEGRGMKELALLNSQNDIIASGQTNFYKAIIYYPQNSRGEFFIEAKGDKGGYGFLDPYYAGGLVGNWTFNGPDMNWASTTAEALDRSGYNNNGDVTVGGLVGYWKLDENPAEDTTPIIDFSGQRNNGTLTTNDGSTNKSVSGHLGQAIDFDGVVNHYVNAGTPASLNGLTNLTYSAWIKPISFSSNGTILGKRYKQFYVNTSAYLKFLVSTDSTPNLEVYCDSPLITLNTWTHVVVIWDGVIGAGTTGKFYINGVQCNFSGNMGAGSANSDTSMNQTIGAIFSSVTGDYESVFNGLIDEVRVYNRALTQSEITELYNGKGGPTPVPGISGQALNFDGVDDYVNAGTNSSLDAPNAFAISAWILWRGTAQSYIVGKSRGAPAQEPSYNYQIQYGDGQLVSSMASGVTDYDLGYTFTPVLNRWYHVIASYDGQDQKLFLDGVQVATIARGALTLVTGSTYTLALGRNNVDSAYFNGTIDEVRVYNRALSQSEITDLYRLGSARVKIRQ